MVEPLTGEASSLHRHRAFLRVSEKLFLQALFSRNLQSASWAHKYWHDYELAILITATGFVPERKQDFHIFVAIHSFIMAIAGL